MTAYTAAVLTLAIRQRDLAERKIAAARARIHTYEAAAIPEPAAAQLVRDLRTILGSAPLSVTPATVTE